MRKDTEAYTDLEEAIMAFEKITSAKFSSKTQIYFEASSKLESDMPVTLFDGETSVATGKTTVGTNKFAAEVTLAAVRLFDYYQKSELCAAFELGGSRRVRNERGDGQDYGRHE